MDDQFGFKDKNLDENKEDRVVKGYANHTNKNVMFAEIQAHPELYTSFLLLRLFFLTCMDIKPNEN